MDLNFDFR